jgi:hypothetical protein
LNRIELVEMKRFAFIMVFRMGLLCILLSQRLKALAAEPESPLQSLVNSHVIRADQDGLAIEPNLSKSQSNKLTKEEFERRADLILSNAVQWATRQPHRSPEANPGPIRVPVLVFVHGGLNTWDDTIKRMGLVDQMLNEPAIKDRCYPVFLSWPAGPFDSYGEHLFSLRRGLRDRTVLKKLNALATFPIVLATDISKAGVGMPMNWAHQGINLADRIVFNSSSSCREKIISDLVKVSEAKASEIAKDYPNTFRRGIIYRNSASSVGMGVQDVAAAPIALSVGTIMQGEPSIAAWQIMNRRTRNLYIPAQTFEWIKKEPGYKHIANNVPAGQFLDILFKRAEEARGDSKYRFEITLVGHSMGTIALNNFFQHSRPLINNSMSLKRIIYMAAACTVRDGAEAVLPLLKPGCTNSLGCDDTRFYNLTLHPLAEISEAMGFHSLPHGSLLYQIDTHLGSPRTAIDRTLGWDVNAISAIDQFRLKENKDTVRFICFDFEPNTIPMAHGDFSRCPYWRSSFIDPTDSRRHERLEKRGVGTSVSDRSEVNLPQNWANIR